MNNVLSCMRLQHADRPITRRPCKTNRDARYALLAWFPTLQSRERTTRERVPRLPRWLPYHRYDNQRELSWGALLLKKKIIARAPSSFHNQSRRAAPANRVRVARVDITRRSVANVRKSESAGEIRSKTHPVPAVVLSLCRLSLADIHTVRSSRSKPGQRGSLAFSRWKRTTTRAAVTLLRYVRRHGRHGRHGGGNSYFVILVIDAPGAVLSNNRSESCVRRAVAAS